MFESIQQFCDQAIQGFAVIPETRKKNLALLADYIPKKIDSGLTCHLMFVCTHNSRRSHFGQVWAAVAADYYKIENIRTWSGGTEATAFNPNAINSLKRIGFEIHSDGSEKNPHYAVRFAADKSVECFSKRFDDISNPSEGFAAVMTCSDADENCPFIPGVDLRIATTYDDPKAFDGTPLQDAKYDERSLQIATELLYAFSLVGK